MTHYLYYLSYTCIWRTQKELVIILLKVRQLLRHIDVSLLFSKKSLVVVRSWQGESKSCHVHIKMDGPGQRLKKPFLQATHTTAILENSSSTSSCRCVATVPSAQKCGPARKKARRKLRSNSFPSRWPGPSKTLLPVL